MQPGTRLALGFAFGHRVLAGLSALKVIMSRYVFCVVLLCKLCCVLLHCLRLLLQ